VGWASRLTRFVGGANNWEKFLRVVMAKFLEVVDWLEVMASNGYSLALIRIDLLADY